MSPYILLRGTSSSLNFYLSLLCLNLQKHSPFPFANKLHSPQSPTIYYFEGGVWGVGFSWKEKRSHQLCFIYWSLLVPAGGYRGRYWSQHRGRGWMSPHPVG